MQKKCDWLISALLLPFIICHSLNLKGSTHSLGKKALIAYVYVMPEIKAQRLCFLKVSFHLKALSASFTPLAHALILQDICGYNTGIQDLKSSVVSP